MCVCILQIHTHKYTTHHIQYTHTQIDRNSKSYNCFYKTVPKLLVPEGYSVVFTSLIMTYTDYEISCKHIILHSNYAKDWIIFINVMENKLFTFK